MFPILILVKEIMKEPISINEESSIFDALRILLDKNISRLLIKKDQNITSIITEKDIGIFLLSDTSDRKLDEIKISNISKPLITLDENSDAHKAAGVMLENGIGSLAVKNNKITGIVTKTDLAKVFAEKFSGKKIVGEYMSPYYTWAYSDSPLSKIVSKMLHDKVSRLILRNRDEVPIGILSFRDLFRTALTEGEEQTVIDNADPAISVVFPRKGFLSETGFGGTTKASDIMKDEIISVNYDDDLAKACKVMIESKINGVAVLSGRGALVGILSKTDVMKALAFL